MNPDLRECFLLFPAWSEIVGYVSRSDAREADPQSVYGAACGCDLDRLAALLYARSIAETMDDAHHVLDEVLRMARDGRRPRFGREIEFIRDVFEEPEAQS